MSFRLYLNKKAVYNPQHETPQKFKNCSEYLKIPHKYVSTKIGPNKFSI